MARNDLTQNLTSAQALRRRWAFNEAVTQGKLSKEARDEFVLENYGEHGEKAFIHDGVVLKNDTFIASMKKLRELGCTDDAFLEALELGRALAEGEFDVFDLFAIWCDQENRWERIQR